MQTAALNSAERGVDVSGYTNLLIAAALAISACNESQSPPHDEADMISGNDSRELIILSAPQADDRYYADVADQIFDFHVAYARQVIGRDDIVILTDEARYDDYVAALGPDHVMVAPQEDIWLRDFGLSNATSPIMFRYTAAGQAGSRDPQSDADAVQEELASLLERAGIDFDETALLNDGGNFVDDYAGRVVVSRKFLRDNELTEAEGRAEIIATTSADHVAFIEADEQGGLEHADGVVAFIAPNVLVINSYPEDPSYAAALRADLEAGLPDVTIYEIVTPYDGSNIYDPRFGSACGLYTNMLVTPSRIYLPQFGIPEDAEALAAVRRWTDKEVVPVRSGQICPMGGGVRCMSWQLRGENAERFLEWARS